MSKKLVAQIKGGLGNQLFAYATSRRLAYINNAELIIDDISGFANESLYQRSYSLDKFNIHARKASYWERGEPFGRVRRRLDQKINSLLPLEMRGYIQQSGVNFDPYLLTLKLRDGVTYFEGFGQSEDYFKDIEGVIRSDLQIKDPVDAINQGLAKIILAENSVALHIRWFDFDSRNSKNNVALDYYLKAINSIVNSVNNPIFFIFSDQTEFTKKNLAPYLANIRTHYVDHNQLSEMAYADLWLMSKCSHFIIANSTFSWWGAWIGEKVGKSQVYAPGIFIDPQKSVTAWGFKGLIPKRWRVL